MEEAATGTGDRPGAQVDGPRPRHGCGIRGRQRWRGGPGGASEIAERSDAKIRTVSRWRGRRVLPEPGLVAAGHPVWRGTTIGTLAHETGRVPGKEA